MKWFDLLFPLRCVNCGRWEVWLCEECQGKMRRREGEVKRIEGIDELMVLYEYEEVMQKMIKAIKYRFCRDLIEVIMDGVRMKKRKVDVIVPIPLYWLRENWRGFNQAEVIGEKVEKEWGVPMEKILLRKRMTRPVAELSGEERRKEVEGVFEVVGEVKGKRVLLVDDVFTSGATMGEAARALKARGVKRVIGFCLAA